ncbi:Tetratricopeptide repeat superfamily protein [Perilla frutescens var. frutescens]|nr:Tetratricopeptide repeat superfamily protein [Perilla frutescens var. frutescens]
MAASPALLPHTHTHRLCIRFNSPLSLRLSSSGFRVSIQCSDSTRGFGPKSRNPDDTKKKMKSSPKQQQQQPNQAPGLSSTTGPAGKANYTSSDDLQFEQRLQAIRMSALEQKKTVDEKEYGAIDYDTPTANNSSSTIGLGTKIGVGVAVVAFGLVFALGDFLPSGSVSPTEDTATVNKISDEERATLEKRLKEFEETLATSPEDSTALEGAAVTLAEMREYKRAATLLEKLTEKKPRDPDAFRLLGEVKYELKDYEGSVLAYRSAERASESVDFEILRGLTNSLLAAQKPDEAVQMLLAARERLSKEQSSGDSDGTVKISAEMRSDVDPIQVNLLLGKAYSDWGHISDAVAVYDQLISSHPDDFRGYLAKGIILKENGSVGDAERMFIQARFFAPDKAKALVDKYSR